jgi:hypothetical protein
VEWSAEYNCTLSSEQSSGGNGKVCHYTCKDRIKAISGSSPDPISAHLTDWMLDNAKDCPCKEKTTRVISSSDQLPNGTIIPPRKVFR